MINEPTAAAIAYGLPKLNRDMTFIVLDLGGGTFDVTVLELFESTIEVHASAGDTRNYPGDNFTNHALSMPTKKKQSVPEAITHSMARGICGLAIFLDDADRRYFLDQLSQSINKNNHLCYGYALMSNPAVPWAVKKQRELLKSLISLNLLIYLRGYFGGYFVIRYMLAKRYFTMR